MLPKELFIGGGSRYNPLAVRVSGGPKRKESSSGILNHRLHISTITTPPTKKKEWGGHSLASAALQPGFNKKKYLRGRIVATKREVKERSPTRYRCGWFGGRNL